MFANPFSLPDRPDPREALDPLNGDASQVLNHYVDVDNTESAFSQFQGTFPSARGLGGRGQLVVAMGKDGCGKSALINRCAWRAEEIIKSAGLQAVVVDVRTHARVTEEVPTRIRQVADYLREYLRRKGYLDVGDNELEDLRAAPNDIYSRLDLYLSGDKTIVVIRLPRTELVEEIVEYAQFCHARVVFLAELRGSHDAEDVKARLSVPDRRAPIVLDVGLLSDGHAWEFVRHRYELSGHPADLPRLSETTAERMISSRRQPIRELQKVLFLLYEKWRQMPHPPPEISWENVLEFYYEMADELRQRTDG